MPQSERLISEIENIRKELKVVQLLNRKIIINNDLDEIEIRAAALSLISIYGGIEKVLSLKLGNKLQKSGLQSWHKELLILSVREKHISENLP